MPRRPLKDRLAARVDTPPEPCNQLPEGQPAPTTQPEHAAPPAPSTPVEPAPQESPTLTEPLTREASPAPTRDSLGFPTGAVPHITADQLRWLTYRLETGDNLEACEKSNTDPFTVLGWLGDADFRAVFDQALQNKREAAKTLAAHLIPSSLRAIQDVLAEGTHKDKLQAVNLVARLQGLLIDNARTNTADSIVELFKMLREERPVQAQIIDMTDYKALAPPTGE